MWKAKGVLTAVLVVGSIAAGCSQINGRPTRQQLTVFAASSLSDAMDALAEGFEVIHPEVEVLRHYASSSQLAAQILEGAPADVFASANQIQMGHVSEAGLALYEPQVFATNQLTICVPAGNPGGIYNPQDLAIPGIHLIIGADQTPIRVYTDQLLRMLGDDQFQAIVSQNVVSEEVNVRQIAAKIALGEADAGVIYTSDISADLRSRLEQVEIPTEFNLTALYPAAVIADSQIPEIAQEFVEYLLSEAGQAVLAAWGFGPIPFLEKSQD